MTGHENGNFNLNLIKKILLLMYSAMIILRLHAKPAWVCCNVGSTIRIRSFFPPVTTLFAIYCNDRSLNLPTKLCTILVPPGHDSGTWFHDVDSISIRRWFHIWINTINFVTRITFVAPNKRINSICELNIAACVLSTFVIYRLVNYSSNLFIATTSWKLLL